MSTETSPNLTNNSTASKKQSSAIDRFSDCALIEIIHLHDCLRGALKSLQNDVSELRKETNLGNKIGDRSSGQDTSSTSGSRDFNDQENNNSLLELEKRIAGRFKIIWSVFSAHSKAEDEFIWPALQKKLNLNRKITNSNCYKSKCISDRIENNIMKEEQEVLGKSGGSSGSKRAAALVKTEQETSRSKRICLEQQHQQQQQPETRNEESIIMDSAQVSSCTTLTQPEIIEPLEYEEDHADEERMFSEMNQLLSKLKENLPISVDSSINNVSNFSSSHIIKDEKSLDTFNSTPSSILSSKSKPALRQTMQQHQHQLVDLTLALSKMTAVLSAHLLQHLQKEEEQCMPLVVKHLSKEEIHDLVGEIMGKRSSDIVGDILNMAVQNLKSTERNEMVEYMKEAMVGTFFERWLTLGGYFQPEKKVSVPNEQNENSVSQGVTTTSSNEASKSCCKACHGNCLLQSMSTSNYSSNDLQTLIKSIALNKELSAEQKTKTIQDLRKCFFQQEQRSIAAKRNTISHTRRSTAPSSYYKMNISTNKIELVFSSDPSMHKFAHTESSEVPLFSTSELAPSYHDGARSSMLGCPHYRRSCKLRHPKSGRLYVCRLCCEQDREIPGKDADSPLDRYEVKEILCMICGSLQPASQSCINKTCESFGKPFSRYSCSICNLYDDDPSKNIYHCPFCNVCRKGKGLGIDFRHCMRCNACVSMKRGKDSHVCIPQRLQGHCPICHESLFESTSRLKGLKCGHVMHFECFNKYFMRGQLAFTCPLCKKSMEDMKDYFDMLDAAVRMQPMPIEYANVLSQIYCQDCAKSSEVPYHFVGCKCPSCGSYNTRETQRIHLSVDNNTVSRR